ncbi:uncharacterized protein EI90DRAFT_3013377 [Cantharellus anzutake]|uniref:uncharacterized protein n=1 Tax=Cantharellus anzutake TaxID=1750568 RepID=UPI001906B6AA|nr:uncharacterized protein EI90DRAFT_3013377 [Cantharellus anzutake]KAF8338045.1 hypothetical protein EI90DRAFT_3013377 [Cantharellus anzutake]
MAAQLCDLVAQSLYQTNHMPFLEENERLATDDGTNDIRAGLRRIHMDEIVGLSRDGSNRHSVNCSNLARYLRFVVVLWTRVMTAIVMGGLGIFGSFSLIPFAVNGHCTRCFWLTSAFENTTLHIADTVGEFRGESNGEEEISNGTIAPVNSGQ